MAIKRILVADDKATSREFVASVLGGYEIIEAENGSDALEKIRAAQPDLVLLDLHMPVLDGFGVVEALRKEARFAELPVIALTASAMAGDRERALASGFNEYLTKPITPSALRQALRRFTGE